MNDPLPLRILVIEDEADARANLRDILELDGHHVEEAGTAAQALTPRDWHALDAIILDRLLPDSNAEQLLPKLRALAPSAAVIIVTGYADLQGTISALRQGASDYILKPLNPDALVASLVRLAERRRLAREKERSEANFRHLVEMAECLILILRPDRTLAYFSPFAERLTGFASDEVLGLDYFELLMPEPERRAAVESFVHTLGGSQVQGDQATIRCRDGAARWVMWNARLLPDYDGGPAILAVGQDITSLKEAQERLVQSERLAAIGQMVAGLAHESRNALQRSQACLEMLRFEVEGQPRALDLIGRLQAAQEHLHHLYEDVRGYAAPIKLERRSVRLDEVWGVAWQHAGDGHLNKEATLHDACGGRINLVVNADPFRLGQVFRNIFENALAACASPISIRVWAEDGQLGGQPAIRVHVRDNGPGVSLEVRQKLFEPFFTTKTRGTGLGLSIARRIIEAHGGRIALADQNGPGAEFLITLPRD